MYNFVLDTSFCRPSFGIEKDNFVEMVGQVQLIGVHLNLKGNKQFGGNILIEDILKSVRSNLAECTLLFDNFLSCATYLIASPALGKTTSTDATSRKACSKQCNLIQQWTAINGNQIITMGTKPTASILGLAPFCDPVEGVTHDPHPPLRKMGATDFAVNEILSFGQVQVALYKVAFNKVEDALVKVESWKVALALEEHGAETEVV
ncbi:hypothetical protein C8F01DRAFT_1091596 [Mycena amicta]|nr:hypothetical protein C8F01DRAFT_1091596 [Mycena amicta]